MAYSFSYTGWAISTALCASAGSGGASTAPAACLGGAKPVDLAASSCHPGHFVHCWGISASQKSIRSSNGSPTAAHHARRTFSGAATRSSASMITGVARSSRP